MRTPHEIAKENIEVFIEKYPLSRSGWAMSSKYGHQAICVRELASSRTRGRRFDVTISDLRGSVSILYERLEKDCLRPLSVPRRDQPNPRPLWARLSRIGAR